MTETSDAVQLEIRDSVATVTIARPERRNAFDDGMIAALRHHFLTLARDEALRAVVLRGEGDHFSGGADLGWMQRMADYDYKANVEDAHVLAGMLHALHSLPMPTVAVVRGAAFGGAIGLIACCDMAIATEDAIFALSEVKIGLVPATISPYVLRAMGERACGRLFLTGERFTAQRALETGLVSEVVSPDELDARCEHLLAELKSAGPQATRIAKRLLRDVSGQPIDSALIDDTCQTIAEIRVSSEGQAGLSAFLEKRPAPWREMADP